MQSGPPPKPVPKRLLSLLDRLTDEVRTAQIHYTLHVDLKNATVAYNREMNQAPAFWQMTIRSHWDLAAASIFRSYDKAADGINLQNFLRSLKNHTLADIRQVTEDLGSVTAADPIVQNLVWHRNNLFAHINLRNVESGFASQRNYPVTFGDFEILLQRAKEILNRYSVLLSGTNLGFDLVNDKDYLVPLQSVRESLQRRDAKWVDS